MRNAECGVGFFAMVADEYIGMVDVLFLGIDLGTSRVKVGAYDRQGNQHGFAVAGSWSEIPWMSTSIRNDIEGDAEAWWRNTCQAIRETLHVVGTARVAGVCVGGQGPSLVAVDTDGRVVRPALMYDDSRAAPEAAALSARVGRTVSVRNSYLPRALWMRNHEPQAYAATRHFLQAWDFIVYRLTGTAAATSPLGRHYTPWEGADVVAAGLDPGRFPPLVRTGERVGSVCGAAAAETGLPAGTPVIAGGGDFLLGTMGAAGAHQGVAQSQGGTTGAFTLCWDRPLEGDMIGWSIPSPVRPGLFNAGGPLTTGGAALDWLLGSVLQVSTSYERALADAADVPAGAEGLLFFPYLAGEQLVLSQKARGVLLGLCLRHGARHLIRAVLEGVALAGRSIMEALVGAGGRVDEVVTYGGQACSALWNQIKADVWNRPVCIPRVLDVGCLGAAAIAAVGAGAYPALSDASEGMAQTGCRYLPDPGRAAVYDGVYGVYREIYPRTQDLFEKLEPLRERDAADCWECGMRNAECGERPQRVLRVRERVERGR